MNIAAKILTSFITLTFAVIGGIWTATTVILHTMDSKVADARTEITREMDLRKEARDKEIKIIVDNISDKFKDHQEHFDKRLDTIERYVKQ